MATNPDSSSLTPDRDSDSGSNRANPDIAHAFFCHFADGLSDALIILDEELHIQAFNKAAEQIFGYPASLVIGKRFTVLDRPMTLDTGEALPIARFPGITALRTGRNSEQIHISLTDSERAIHRVQLSAYPWSTAPDGHPTHVALILTDVTPVISLEEHASRLERVISQAADAILILDDRGIVREANPAFTRLTGIEPHEIIRGSLRIIEHRDQDHAAFTAMMDALSHGEIWSNRITHRSKRGEGVDCLGTLSPLYLKGGRLTGFVYMLRDMSKIAEMEKRMIRSQKMEAIGTLAGGIAHDFNNILHSISGYAELAAASEDDPRVRNYLDNVLGACERAGSLVRQILTFSRREERSRRPVLLRGELEKAMKFIRVTLPTTAEIESRIECEDAAVMADPTEIHQLIINLLTNAFQALPNGVGKLTLGARLLEITQSNRGARSNLNFGPYVEISVIDTGKGIPPEIMDRIFEPFFTTKPVNEGTGMGLSIVHGIVSSMQGDISVESHVGHGTKFTLLLPASPLADTETAPVREKPAKGNERLLIVDDEEVITGMVSEMLTGLGYEVTVENDPLLALKRLAADPLFFDLVLTDQTMPHHTGLQLAEQIRAIRPDLPVLLCTGTGEPDFAERAKATGVSRLLNKPLRLADLAKAVRETLDECTALPRREFLPFPPENPADTGPVI